MNITFLIGNGFDVGLGLKTKYSHFYETLKEHSENIIEADIFRKTHSEEANDKLYWKDYELGLGELLREIQTEPEKEKFKRDKFAMDDRIVSYIATEESRYTEDFIKKNAFNFYKNLLRFHFDLVKNQKNDIENKLSGAKSIEFNFITFNYTNILDRYINEINGLSEKDEKYIFKTPLHIHGDLINGIITGVDNTSQIGNKGLADDVYFKSTIIKRTQNEYHGEGRTQSAINWINASDIVCVFGMSLGETDYLWWEQIKIWLQAINKILIIYDYGEKVNFLSLSERTDYIISVRQKFIKASACTNIKTEESIFNKIYVIQNSKIFEFKIKESENNGQIEDAHP